MVVSAIGSTKTKRVLLGRSGSEKSFAQLADGLRSEGFKVVEEKSSPVGAHSTAEAIEEVLDGIDVVLLVVHKNDGILGPSAPFERVMQDAEIIQQSIGAGQVVLLVEETVDGLPPTEIEHVRFPTSRADMVLQDVVNKIGVPPAPEARDLHARVPVSEQAMSGALRVPWLLVLIVLLSAAIPLAIVLNSLFADDGVDVVVIQDVASAIETPPAASGTLPPAASGTLPPAASGTLPPAAPEGSTTTGVEGQFGAAVPDTIPPGAAVSPQVGVAGVITLNRPPTESEATQPTVESGAVPQPAPDPASPSVTLGADNDLLPAVCEVDLERGVVLNAFEVCRDVGVLVTEGPTGPWHNNIRAVVVVEGVVGELYHELRSNGTTEGPPVVGLSTGVVVLNPSDAAFGVDRLVLRFSAHGQHIHLYPNADGSGEYVTLRFSLDG